MHNFIKKINVSIKTSQIILALGAESAGNFSIYKNGIIYHSKNFGDLLDENNFIKFQKYILSFLKERNIKPHIILTDLHPEMKTTAWGKTLAKKISTKNKKTEHIKVQHHHAHIFSQIKINDLLNNSTKLNNAYSVVLDGTGYGLDEKTWGGEIFKIIDTLPNQKHKYDIQRIGHLENQTMLSGDLAIKEPARMLISILKKFLKKEEAYDYIKKYYNQNEFELLWNQLEQNFNCQETSSTGRILDAASILLGFANNERKQKHEATYLLEKNSTKPYQCHRLFFKENIFKGQNNCFQLNTTYLFKYLIKNIHRDKKRLAATVQFYIAQGLHQIIKKQEKSQMSDLKSKIYLSGGISNNKIISNYFETQGILQNKKIYPTKSSRSEFNRVPRGDAGLSFGQIVCHLLTLE